MDTLNILLDIKETEYLSQEINRRLLANEFKVELLPLVEFCWLFGEIGVEMEGEKLVYEFKTCKLN